MPSGIQRGCEVLLRVWALPPRGISPPAVVTTDELGWLGQFPAKRLSLKNFGSGLREPPPTRNEYPQATRRFIRRDHQKGPV